MVKLNYVTQGDAIRRGNPLMAVINESGLYALIMGSTVALNGVPWFVAKDVCTVLGYKDVSMSLSRHVDDDDRQPFNLNSTTNRRGMRGNPHVSVISESGLYSLITGSTVTHNGAPWFVAKDVCSALDMPTEKGTGRWTAGLDGDEKQSLRNSGGSGMLPQTVNEVLEDLVASTHLMSGVAGRPPRNFVSESGLYSLILKSRKPEAKAFKKWVTSVALPAIRKDGAYIKGEENVATGEMDGDGLIARASTALTAKVDRLTAPRAHPWGRVSSKTIPRFGASLLLVRFGYA